MFCFPFDSISHTYILTPKLTGYSPPDKELPKDADDLLVTSTMLYVASNAYKDGYRKLIIVVGADQVGEFKNLIPKYNGVDGRHGFYNFEEIKVVSAGNRVDPESEKAKEITADTMSASVLRKLAADGKFDEWVNLMCSIASPVVCVFNVIFFKNIIMTSGWTGDLILGAGKVTKMSYLESVSYP